MQKFLHILSEVLKYAVILTLVGGLVWWFFGRQLLSVASVRNVDLAAVLTVKGDEVLVKGINSQLKLSLLWRQYALHLPPSEIVPGKPPLQISGTFKRRKHELKGDLPEASHSFSPGSVELRLQVKALANDTVIVKQIFRREAPTIVLQDAGGAVAMDQIEKRLRDTEAELASKYLGAQLDYTALQMMGKRPDLAAQYVPIIAEAVGNAEPVVAAGAGDILCGLTEVSRNLAVPVLRRLTDSDQPAVRERARKILACCDTREKKKTD